MPTPTERPPSPSPRRGMVSLVFLLGTVAAILLSYDRPPVAFAAVSALGGVASALVPRTWLSPRVATWVVIGLLVMPYTLAAGLWADGNSYFLRLLQGAVLASFACAATTQMNSWWANASRPVV